MIAFLHAAAPNPIVFTIGPYAVHWYGFLLAAGIGVAYALFMHMAKQSALSQDLLSSLFFQLVLWGFVGARALYILTNWEVYAPAPLDVIAVWRGGLALHGALISGMVALLLFARRMNVSFWKIADMSAVAAILGQAIGRWGNYFNQELFGAPTHAPWGIPIDPARRPAGFEAAEFFHPTFLYESLWNAAVFVILFFAWKRFRGREGVVLWLYIGLYSLGRAGTELLRIDDTPMVLGIRAAFAASIAAVCISALMVVRRLNDSGGGVQRNGKHS